MAGRIQIRDLKVTRPLERREMQAIIGGLARRVESEPLGRVETKRDGGPARPTR